MLLGEVSVIYLNEYVFFLIHSYNNGISFSVQIELFPVERTCEKPQIS